MIAQVIEKRKKTDVLQGKCQRCVFGETTFSNLRVLHEEACRLTKTSRGDVGLRQVVVYVFLSAALFVCVSRPHIRRQMAGNVA